MSFSSLHYDQNAIETMIAGLSVLDVPHVSVQSRAEAYEFLRAYGYDLEREDDLQKLWNYHRKAVTYIQGELLKDSESIPVKLSDPKELGDISNILIMASTRSNDLQKWACGILKVMHTYVHLENDLFGQFSSEIQEQILKPIQAHVNEDPVIGTTLGPVLGPDSIVLKKFEIKAFKSTTSAVTKLLAKSELIAFGLLDKVGVRIITKHLYDVFRVLKYFLDQNIVSFPNNVSGQSNNSLFPLNIFFETIESLTQKSELTGEEMDQLLRQRLERYSERAEYNEKHNSFSSQDYRFLKFITRRLVRINQGSAESPRPLTFFYPYEVQIVDYETHLKNMMGPASHHRYKERQIRRARARIMGVSENL